MGKVKEVPEHIVTAWDGKNGVGLIEREIVNG